MIDETPPPDDAARRAATRARQNAHLKPFQFGNKMNPGGRPKNSRNRLQGAFLNALANDFDKHGKDTIARARRDDPMGYIKAIVQLMPRQFEQTTPLEDLSDDELIQGINFLRSRLAESVIAGGGTAGESKPLADLRAIPETIGIPQRGFEFSGTSVDGGESAR